jgi:hypothetical protein
MPIVYVVISSPYDSDQVRSYKNFDPFSTQTYVQKIQDG